MAALAAPCTRGPACSAQLCGDRRLLLERRRHPRWGAELAHHVRHQRISCPRAARLPRLERLDRARGFMGVGRNRPAADKPACHARSRLRERTAGEFHGALPWLTGRARAACRLVAERNPDRCVHRRRPVRSIPWSEALGDSPTVRLQRQGSQLRVELGTELLLDTSTSGNAGEFKSESTVVATKPSVALDRVELEVPRPPTVG